MRPAKGGKSNKQAQKIGPFKFTYKQLQKQGVLVDSEVPMITRGSVCIFSFSFFFLLFIVWVVVMMVLVLWFPYARRYCYPIF